MNANTYAKSILLFCMVALSICHQITNAQTTYYASSAGSGAGTQNDPASLTAGLGLLANGDILHLAAGTYNIDNPLIDLIPDNATVEGGFDPNNGWTKSGTTIIHRTAANIEGSDAEQRIGAIYQTGRKRFHDT